jgi:hypothetical protein
MPKVRSPNYPTTDLGTALGLIRPVFKAEHRNKMSRAVLAKHMGFNSLNGRSLTNIGAVRAYGLIEGSGDQVRVSEDAVRALNAPEQSDERGAALAHCAFQPSLFKEIRQEYPQTLPSEENLRYWLITKGYTERAAGKATESYLKTMQLVGGVIEDYNPASYEEEDVPPMTPQVQSPKPGMSPPTPPPKAGMLQEVFNLDEGPVTLTVPATLSEASYTDLADQFELFLRRAKRRVSKPE